MRSVRATARASSEASVPQHDPNRSTASSDRRAAHTRIVTPTASCPCSTSSAAATDESTPPLMPTTTRSITVSPSWASMSRFEQPGKPLELVRRRVGDLDRAAPPVAAKSDARHERAGEPILERDELGGAAPRRARDAVNADRVLRRAYRPVVREDLVAQAQLLSLRRQRE